MTSARDSGDVGFSSRAADSAKCLLVVGGYRHNAGTLGGVVTEAKKQILRSPSLGDFFELRFVDMGPRPDRSASGSAGVARLVLELTSRPGEAARNFSALMIIDQSADAIDRVLRECQGIRVLAKLKVRFYGSATTEDRSLGQDPGTRPEIAIAGSKRPPASLLDEILGYAERLLSDFGSGWEPGLPVNQVDELGAEAESQLRGVVQAAAKAEAEASREARRAEQRRAEQRLSAARRWWRAETGEETEASGVANQSSESEVARNAESIGENPVGLKTEAELSREAERKAREAEVRIIAARYEAKYRELEAQLEAERARTAEAAADREALIRQSEAERTAELPPVESSREQQPSADTAEPRADTADDGASAEETQPEQQLKDRPRAKALGPARALADVAESSAALLFRIGGRLAAPSGRGARPDAGAALLLEGLARLADDDIPQFRTCLARLRAYTDAGVSVEDRERSRVIVVENGLLRPGLPLGSLDYKFYDVLLRLVYGLPLSYAAYCEVEDLSGTAAHSGPSPHRPLLEAISDGGQLDIRVTAITRYHLGQEGLSDWFRSRRPNVGQLISALAGDWIRPYHAHLVYDVTLRYLDEFRTPFDQHAVRGALRENGYLVAALRELYPQSDQDQAMLLGAFLRAAYPAGLDRLAVKEIFAAGGPSAPLARAVLRLLADPADAAWAIRVFVDRCGSEMSPVQEAKLVDLLTSEPRTAELVESLTKEPRALSEGK